MCVIYAIIQFEKKNYQHDIIIVPILKLIPIIVYINALFRLFDWSKENCTKTSYCNIIILFII
jgi:hypothetical protein